MWAGREGDYRGLLSGLPLARWVLAGDALPSSPRGACGQQRKEFPKPDSSHASHPSACEIFLGISMVGIRQELTQKQSHPLFQMLWCTNVTLVHVLLLTAASLT